MAKKIFFSHFAFLYFPVIKVKADVVKKRTQALVKILTSPKYITKRKERVRNGNTTNIKKSTEKETKKKMQKLSEKKTEHKIISTYSVKKDQQLKIVSLKHFGNFNKNNCAGCGKISNKLQKQQIWFDMLFVVAGFTKLASNMILCVIDMTKKLYNVQLNISRRLLFSVAIKAVF